MPSIIPNELFTWESLATLGGASAGTLLISNTLQKLFNFNPKWFALALAEVISLAVALMTDFSVQQLIIGLINGCLVYATAVGANSIGGAATKPSVEKPEITGDGVQPRFQEPNLRKVARANRAWLDGWWSTADRQQLHAS